MSITDLADARALIDGAWEHRSDLDAYGHAEALRTAVDMALDALDEGVLRAAEPTGDGWRVNEWAKKAILLSFRLYPMRLMGSGIGGHGRSYDKLPLKTAEWDETDFVKAGFRAVPPTATDKVNVRPLVTLCDCGWVVKLAGASTFRTAFVLVADPMGLETTTE